MGAGGRKEERVEAELHCSTLQLQPPSTLHYKISLIAGIATDSFVAGQRRQKSLHSDKNMVCGITG